MGRGIKAAEDVHQRGFAAAGGADDGDELPDFNVQRDIIQGADLLPAQVVVLAQIADFDQCHTRANACSLH